MQRGELPASSRCQAQAGSNRTESHRRQLRWLSNAMSERPYTCKLITRSLQSALGLEHSKKCNFGALGKNKTASISFLSTLLKPSTLSPELTSAQNLSAVIVKAHATDLGQTVSSESRRERKSKRTNRNESSSKLSYEAFQISRQVSDTAFTSRRQPGVARCG